jgi:hypothetical protein
VLPDRVSVVMIEDRIPDCDQRLLFVRFNPAGARRMRSNSLSPENPVTRFSVQVHQEALGGPETN